LNRPEQAQDYAEKMLGYNLITKQTGAAGRKCSKVGLRDMTLILIGTKNTKKYPSSYLNL
jgi:hypothetical protein